MESKEAMEVILSISMGLGLSAACGFRIFVPMLVISIASKAGHLELADSFEWMSSTPALIAFASATALEVAGYYVPWVDNLLDTVAAPTAVVAGVVATASQVHMGPEGMSPLMGWSIAVIGGGGVAAIVQGLTTVTRQISSLATGGLGNPVVSTVEGGASIVMTALAVIVPPLAILAILGISFYAVKKIFFRKKAATAAIA